MFKSVNGESVKQVVDLLNKFYQEGMLFDVIYMGESGSMLYPFCAVIRYRNRGE